MKNWSYYNPVSIHYSDNFVRFLSGYVKNIDNHGNVVVFCYQWFKQTDHCKKLKNEIKNLFSYSDIEENPSLESCQKAIDSIKNLNPAVIIAIGGGSVIDTAKVARAGIYKNNYNINELFNIQTVVKNIPTFIAIPTTHGTGSEVTMWATVWDKVKKIKKSLSEKENYPNIALYDVGLVKDLPVKLSMITTLDALSHAFESIWNKNRNPISTEYAIQAIKLIYENIEGINENTSIDIRKNLMKASMYAGLAFSNTKTAAAHSISYPLTLYYSIPHGIACSMTLSSLFKINKGFIKDELESILTMLNINNINDFWNIVLKVIQNKIPFALNEYGITKKDIPFIVSKSLYGDRIKNNIVDLNEKIIERVIRSIY